MTHPSSRIPFSIDPSAGSTDAAPDPHGNPASNEEVGAQLALMQEHLRGMHVEPRQDCWRCSAAALREPSPR